MCTFNESLFKFHFFNQLFNARRNFRIVTILFPVFLLIGITYISLTKLAKGEKGAKYQKRMKQGIRPSSQSV